MAGLKRIITGMKDKQLKVKIREENESLITFLGKTTEISVPVVQSEFHNKTCSADLEKLKNTETFEDLEKNVKAFEFSIDSEKLKSVLCVAELFYEAEINITEDLTPVNFIFRSPDVFYTTFISTEQ